MKHLLLLFLIAGLWTPAPGSPATADPIQNPKSKIQNRETHRIRITNRKSGAIEISLNAGRDWTTVGRVTRPATDSGAGFAALAAAAPGAVAAVSLDAITVRTDQPGSANPKSRIQNPKSGAPRIFNLLPAAGVGGAYSITTDLPRGRALFGTLAPPVGAQLLLENESGGTRPLPGGYIPQGDDRLLIVATVPADAPAMLLFENRDGGRVLSVNSSGDESVVGQVRRPLRGVARYPATEGAACGGVVSHHPAAVVVATTPSSPAPDRGAPEAQPGGFLIQPAATAAGLKPEEGSVLVVDRLAANGPPFSLPIALSPLGGSLAGETRVEVRLDGGPWEPLPAIGGGAGAGAALTAEALAAHFQALGVPRSFSDGVTHLRLVLAPPSPERLRAALGQASAEGAARVATAPAAGGPGPRPASARRPVAGGSRVTERKPAPAKGARKATKTLRIVANIQGQGITYVLFYVDGRMRKMTNTPPFEWLWDTRVTPNGTHTLEIRGADAQGRILSTQTRQVEIYN